MWSNQPKQQLVLVSLMPGCDVTFLQPKMNRINTTFVLLLLSVSAVSGQIITTPQARADLLGGMQATLGNTEIEAADFSKVKSPFEPQVHVEPVPITKDLTNIPAPVTKGRTLPDEQALSIISNQFKPLGSLVLGARGILQLAGGNIIEQGESFRAEISGNIYEVTIVEVTSRGYTLGLGAAQLKKNFLTTTGTTE